MTKLKKGVILSLLFSAILVLGISLVPTTSYAKVYFIGREDEVEKRPPTKRPCEARGFSIIPNKHCGQNQVGSGECENEPGVGTQGVKLYRSCVCPAKYSIAANACEGKQEVIGTPCKTGTEEKYEKCGCSRSKYPFNATSPCPSDVQPDGSLLVTKIIDTRNSAPVCTENGTNYYGRCYCPETFKFCASPQVASGRSCDGKSELCVCPSKFQECRYGGYGESCSEGSLKKYANCYAETDLIKFTAINATKPGSNVCSLQDEQRKIEGKISVTFEKDGFSPVTHQIENSSNVRIPPPFDIDDTNVRIKIQAEGYADFSDTCPCNNRVFGMSPIYPGIRIIATWGTEPNDIDSHLDSDGMKSLYYYGGCDGSNCNTADGSKKSVRRDGNKPMAYLDVDRTQCYGPETTTIAKDYTSRGYQYRLYNFSSMGSGSDTKLSRSNARVQVYDNSRLIAQYNIRDIMYDGQQGIVWYVFNINDEGLLETKNIIESTRPVIK